MRIAIFSPWAVSVRSVGGTERFVVDLSTELQKLGHEVVVYMLTGENNLIRDIRFISLDLLGKGAIADEYSIERFVGKLDEVNSFDNFAAEIERRVDVSEFDVVHLNSILFARCFCHMRRHFTLHANADECELAWGKKAYDSIIRVMSSEILRTQTDASAPSQFYAQEFSSLFHAPIRCIPHAIDANRMKYGVDKEVFCTRNKLSAQKTTITLPSRLELAQKQPDIVLRAARLLPVHILKNMQLLFCGVDKQYIGVENELKALSSKIGADSFFRRFGLDEMPSVYRASDIVVLPSRFESFGYSALESLAMGKATVLNDIPPYHEIGIGNPNAFFFDGTAKNLSEQLFYAISRNESHVAPAEWLARYNMKKWAKEYEEVLS